MKRFMIRIGFPYSFALSTIPEGGIDKTALLAAFPPENGASLDFLRYTFVIILVNAENESEAENAARTAADSAFPEYKGEFSFMSFRSDGSDESLLMHQIYTGLYGAEPYQKLVTELAGIVPILREKESLDVLRTQNYLFAIDSGCGFTTLLSSFGDFIRRTGFYGDESDSRVNYTEYKIAEESGTGAISIEDLKNDLHEHRNVTENGIIGIDIGYFLNEGKNDALRSFVSWLSYLQDSFVFAFRVPFLEKRSLDVLAALLSDVMVTRIVAIPPLHEAVLSETFENELRNAGMEAGAGMHEAFLRYVAEEKRDGRFYGFKTAVKISDEIILSKSVSDSKKIREGKEPDSGTIVPEDIGMMRAGKKESSGFEELNEMIGMEKIAERIREITAQVKISMKNDSLDRPSIHMRFTGAPGTGKTTVARIIGKIFREEGILRKGAFLEYSARMLCAEYVGQTAVKTAAICRDAYGSVLFIDEAYALYTKDNSFNDYGREALTTLISEMENHRDDMLVIMAGYTEDMETLMEGNAGLRSRMPYLIHFPNYSKKQLFEIFMLMVKKHFNYTEELENEAKSYFYGLPDSTFESREFANARFVRNLYERVWSKAALRASLSGEENLVLSRDDFVAASSEGEFSEKIVKRNKIGF